MLQQKYEELVGKYSFLQMGQRLNVNKFIKDALQEFTDSCDNPAIWCYGKHTKMLMTDFIFEMKRVRYIVDAKYKDARESGFCIIGKEQIEACQIDGIIISSFVYREEIKETLKKEYPSIRYLDIYDVLWQKGIVLTGEYFSYNHPHVYYKNINTLKKNISEDKDKERSYQSLINEYIMIKDFQSAISCAEELVRWKPEEQYCRLPEDLKAIYQSELDILAGISEHNVLMLCIDGLRRKDILGDNMPRMKHYLMENTLFFRQAYSVSTSTYESLIPAYGENCDMRTKYYESIQVSEKNCRFVDEAIRQGRKIHFYTDAIAYVDSDKVIVEDQSQTATEKVWSFITDAEEEENGLFYVHILYESHYSYPNPDTETDLVADGSNIMFDFLERNGGKLRTDYIQQHTDAIRYLDKVITPFLEVLPCRMVLYADHGNILLPQGMSLSEVETSKYTCHEDLIQIPFAIKAPEAVTGQTDGLISLMAVNEVILALLREKPFIERNYEHIKVQRSAIYNPDFGYLYKKYGQEQELNAFEVFIFRDGYKIVVYGNGLVRLYTTDDRLLDDEKKRDELYGKIKEEITVL